MTKSELVNAVAERTGGRDIDCGMTPSDGPSGRFQWRWDGLSGSLYLKSGCQTEEGRAILWLVKEIETVVVDWARTRPLTRIHEVRAPVEVTQ